MGRIKAAVLDAGPLIHLNEAASDCALDVISKKFITPEVARESSPSKKIKNLNVVPLDGPGKDYAKLLMERDEIDMGEATSIALCRKERIDLFFTDDLDARDSAKREGLSVHGTLAIVLRCLREGMIGRDEAVHAIDALHQRSSLYVTSDLISYVKGEIAAWANGRR